VDQGKITLADAAAPSSAAWTRGCCPRIRRVEGYPFGSLTPFVASHEGRPVILISSARSAHAERALRPRVCLTVYDPAEKYKLSSSRVSILETRAVPDAEHAMLSDRYFSFFPHSRASQNTSISSSTGRPRVRSYPGSGGSLAAEGRGVARPFVEGQGDGVIAHVNENQRRDRSDMCGISTREIRGALMIAADPEGSTSGPIYILYFVFEKTCLPRQLRNEIAKLASQSRA